MEDMKKYRKRIDELDKIIMDSLEERMEISKEIGKLKLIHNLQTEDKQRENQILGKLGNYNNSKYMRNIYKELFKNSKSIQEYNYFLIGKSLTYSYSPLIYKNFKINDYKLFETNKLIDLKKINFKGINITNPFKNDALKQCDDLDDIALKTNVVNTIINNNGKLIGYNTDFYGFEKTLDYYNLNVEEKKIIIIGNGCTANTIREVLKIRNPHSIINLVRTIKSNDEYNINEYYKFKDYNIIINATPYGTYPNIQDKLLFPIDDFENLETIIDVIYNPLKTPILKTNKKNVKRINGLLMLVAQAAKAASLYTGIDYTGLIEEVYKNLRTSLTNIVLIGMPYSGKSTTGKMIANSLNKNYFDIDQMMQKDNNDLESILKYADVHTFRKLEEQYIENIAQNKGVIISTGGGAILSEKSMNLLGMNSLIVYLDTPLDILVNRLDETRPLIKSKSDLEKLYYERKELYEKYSDLKIYNNLDINNILEKIDEYFSN